MHQWLWAYWLASLIYCFVVNMSWAIFQNFLHFGRTRLLVVVLEFLNSRSCIQHWSVSRFSLTRNTQIFCNTERSNKTDYVSDFQKQLPKVFYNKRCSLKFWKIHRKTPVPESFFIEVAGLKPATLLKRDSGTGVFLWILRNF